MKFTVDTEKQTLSLVEGDGTRDIPLFSPEGFSELSKIWKKVGWDQKYSYSFTWFGRPLIQLPEDVMRMQEVIWQLQPDLIIETGVAHGGSLIFYASLCQAIGKGRVVGVDIEIRPHNRKGIEEHPLFSRISLIEGSSVDPAVVAQVASHVRPDETVLVILDSCHTREHVTRELEAYQRFVTPGSYLVATDGVMQDLSDVPGGNPDWTNDNPAQAARDFASRSDDFELVPPARLFSENQLNCDLTYWPDAWLKRVC